jgi:hypothetical protein
LEKGLGVVVVGSELPAHDEQQAAGAQQRIGQQRLAAQGLQPAASPC